MTRSLRSITVFLVVFSNALILLPWPCDAFVFSTSDLETIKLNQPYAVAAALFFDYDQSLDLAVANRKANNISMFDGAGTNRLKPAGNYAVGVEPVALAAGDFNGDTYPDLAVANRGSNNVSILIAGKDGNGKQDNTFKSAVNYDVGTNPVAIASGDFDKDGKIDLAVTNAGSKNVSILLGKGDGAFQATVFYPCGNNPSAIVVGDFDGDAMTDLAVANAGGNNISLHLGDGKGAFLDAYIVQAGTSPSGLFAYDIDNRNEIDLIVANAGDNSVHVLVSKGKGLFDDPVKLQVGAAPIAVVIGNFGGNLSRDMAVLNSDSDSVLVFKQDNPDPQTGKIRFLAPANYPVGRSPVSMIAADFDQNVGGHDDLAIANSGQGTLTLLKNDNAGITTLQFANSPKIVKSADLNRDGNADLAVLHSTHTFSVFKGLGGGAFDLIGTSSAGMDEGIDLVTGDFNNDGRPDIAILGNKNGDPKLSIFEANGDGTFKQPVFHPVDKGVQLAFILNDRDFSSGDLNGDGNLDLVVRYSNPADEFIRFIIFKGAGDGTFAAVQYSSDCAINMSPGRHPPLTAFALADLNNDKRSDIVFACDTLDQQVPPQRVDQTLRVLLGKVDLTFDPPLIVSTYMPNNAIWGLAPRDFNGDGFTDIVTANGFNLGTVSFFKGDGRGGLALPKIDSAMGSSAWPNFFVGGDFDAKGGLDVMATFDNRDCTMLAGSGDGKFEPPAFCSSGYSESAAVGDLNGDGLDDMAVVDGDKQVLTILLQQAPVVGLSATNYSIRENGGEAVISVKAKRPVNDDGRAFSVKYDVAGVTAVDGTNFAAKSGALNWAGGDSGDKQFTVTIKDTGHENGNMTIKLKLQGAIGAAIDPGAAQAELVIVGNGSTCGNGFKESNEECDDGNVVTESACPNKETACTICDATCKDVAIKAAADTPPPSGGGGPPENGGAPPVVGPAAPPASGGGGGCSLIIPADPDKRYGKTITADPVR